MGKIYDRLTNRNLRMLGIGYVIAWCNNIFFKQATETDKYLKLQLLDKYMLAHKTSLKHSLEQHYNFTNELPDPNVRNLLAPFGI